MVGLAHTITPVKLGCSFLLCPFQQLCRSVHGFKLQAARLAPGLLHQRCQNLNGVGWEGEGRRGEEGSRPKSPSSPVTGSNDSLALLACACPLFKCLRAILACGGQAACVCLRSKAKNLPLKVLPGYLALVCEEGKNIQYNLQKSYCLHLETPLKGSLFWS